MIPTQPPVSPTPEPDYQHLLDSVQLRIASNRLATTRRQQLSRMVPKPAPEN